MNQVAEVNMDKEQLNSYGCELIFQNASLEQAKDISLPNDTYLVYYTYDNKLHMDVCRGKKMSDVFDLYYDHLGPNCVTKITFGYGKTNPKLWGYTAPEKKRKK